MRNNGVAMFYAPDDSEAALRLMQDHSVEKCWKLFYNFQKKCPALVLKRVQQMCMKRENLTEKPSKTLLVTVREWGRVFCAGGVREPKECWSCPHYTEFTRLSSSNPSQRPKPALGGKAAGGMPDIAAILMSKAQMYRSLDPLMEKAEAQAQQNGGK